MTAIYTYFQHRNLRSIALRICAMSQPHYGSANLSKSESYSKFHQRSVLGGFQSFDGDSLPDYSEFDTESVTLEYVKER